MNADKPYYEEVSQKVFEIVDFYCDNIEQVSIDEAYLDLSNPFGFEKAERTAREIKARIFIDLQLTCSIGLSNTKFVAKMASGIKKPNAFNVVKPEQVEHFLSKERIGDLPGVGPKFEEKFKSNHVHFISDIKRHSVGDLIKWFGEANGKKFYDFAFGTDSRLVETNREKQQFSRMITLEEDSIDYGFISQRLEMLSDLVFREITKLNKKFRTVSLVIVTERIDNIVRSKTKAEAIKSAEELSQIETQLLRDYLNESVTPIRRVGVKVSNFGEDYGLQRKLFEFK
jgi:nucleotidyltransferase/DNA polymerase involved in DNA repair